MKKKLTTISIITLIISTTLIPLVNGMNNNRNGIYQTSTDSNFFNDELDQNQNSGSDEEKIYDDKWIAQSFKPTKEKLTRIYLYIGKTGDISSDLIVSIRYLPNSDDLTTAKRSASNIPSIQNWREFNFPDVTTTVNGTYYIVIRTKDGDINNHFSCYGSTENKYNRGEGYNSSDNGSSWDKSFQGSYDVRFRTYGIKYGNETNIDILYIKSEKTDIFSDIYFKIVNTGNRNIENMNINLTLIGGIVLSGKNYHWNVNNFAPQETIERFAYPVIGLGRTYITVKVTTDDGYENSKSEQAILLLFRIHIN
jgi:hypothetical protein